MGLASLAIVLFAGTATGAALQQLQGNVQIADVDSVLGSDRPSAPEPTDPGAGRPLNLLLLGSDTRSGDNAQIAAEDAAGPDMRSDVTILLHVSADRSRVEAVSIPRDSWVTVPPCELPDGSQSEPRTGKFNQAFAIGGASGDVTYAAACTIRTVETLTGIRVDGFLAIDFLGFRGMVDALGGVSVCLPEPIADPDANLYLDAGEQVLDGDQALGLARARKTIDDGSDVSRIDRQQLLLAAIARQATQAELLTDTPRLYAFLDALTSSVTADPRYGSLTSLAGLASSMRGLGAEDLTFVTVPWVPRGDGANVLWSDDADTLFAAVAADTPLTVTPPPGVDAGGTPAPEPSPTGVTGTPSPSGPAFTGITGTAEPACP
ncbi:LCP family protein [Beutenbergia cavernae]|uniref:LCP family protein n=1 Tax=Beutenbergia cavernae TaxID=84757 RepID=UPI00019AD467|nr:LCP family protein [Beutenbergia cavernae]